MEKFPDEPPGGLIRFLATYLALGVAAGVGLTGVLIASDPWLRELIFGSADPVLAVAMFTVANGLTCGSLVMGAAVMTLPLERKL